MELLLLLINVAGAATLLLWAVRMVRTGFERSNGNALRAAVRRAQNGRVRAAGVGLTIAVLLQSSTAVAILAAGFASTAALGVGQGLALLLGADVGSALVVQLLSFDLNWLMPFLLLIGGTLFLKGTSGYARQVGRIILGIGLILLSLKLIGEATGSLKNSEFLAVVMSYLNQDFIAPFLVGAIVTWLLHSSIASILLVATLVSQSVVPLPVALAFVLGSNLGAGLIAYGLTRNQVSAGRRIPVGNLIFRALAAVLAIVALRFITIPTAINSGIAASWVVYAHVVFNIVLLLVCLPFVGLMERLTGSLIPSPIEAGKHLDPLLDRKSVLDRSVLHVPQLALASATRECLRMSDIIELMLHPVMGFYINADKTGIQEVRNLEDMVNKLHSEIKLYLVDIDSEVSTDKDNSRKMELTSFAINMEAVGDIVAKNLLNLAERKNENDLTFSPQGWSELKDLHKQVLANMHLALNTLLSGDLKSARQLIEEKERMGSQERKSNVSHLRRLQTGAVETVETSDIHLETLRALRQINSLFASVAYPILSKSGNLLSSRLTQSRD